MKPLYASIKCENRQEIIKRYISIAMLLRGVKVSSNEIAVLAYFMEHGINTKSKDDIVKELKLAKNHDTFKTMLTRLRSKGIIKKDGSRDVLTRDLQLSIDTEISIALKLYR